jgi:hypothetical protein
MRFGVLRKRYSPDRESHNDIFEKVKPPAGGFILHSLSPCFVFARWLRLGRRNAKVVVMPRTVVDQLMDMAIVTEEVDVLVIVV